MVQHHKNAAPKNYAFDKAWICPDDTPERIF
jgi:hypothetical protein